MSGQGLPTTPPAAQPCPFLPVLHHQVGETSTRPHPCSAPLTRPGRESAGGGLPWGGTRHRGGEKGGAQILARPPLCRTNSDRRLSLSEPQFPPPSNRTEVPADLGCRLDSGSPQRFARSPARSRCSLNDGCCFDVSHSLLTRVRHP